MQFESIPLVLPNRIRVIENEIDQYFVQLLENIGYYSKVVTEYDVEEQVKPSVVVEYTMDNELGFVVNPGAKVFLDSITEPFSVVCIIGCSRSGKSSFINSVFRILSDDKSPFVVSNKTYCCTMGIWIVPQLLTLGDKKIILMDTEGLYGTDSLNGKSQEEEGYYMKLFAITCLMSSVVIFNKSVNLAVGLKDFQEIEKLSAAMYNFEQRDVILKNKPYFIFVARNYNESKSSVEDEQYWKRVLANTNSEQIKTFFNMQFRNNAFVSFMDMKPPSCKNHQNLHLYSLKELNSSFTEKLRWLIEIFLPKIMKPVIFTNPENGKEVVVTGMFYDIIVNIVQSINCNSQLMDMGNIINVAHEGEAHRLFTVQIKEICSHLSNLTLPCLWSDVDMMVENLIDTKSSELSLYLEKNGFNTRFDEDHWQSNSVLLAQIEKLKKNNESIIQGLMQSYLKEKLAIYQKIKDEKDLKNWFAIKLNADHQAKVLQQRLSQEMQLYHDEKTREASDIENQTFTCLFSSIMLNVIDKTISPIAPVTAAGCISQIKNESINYNTLDKILSFLTTPGSILNDLKEKELNRYITKIALMAPLHQKNKNNVYLMLDEFIEEIVEVIKNQMKSIKKVIYNKAASAILCPDIVQSIIYTDSYDPPDFTNFKKYLTQIAESNSNSYNVGKYHLNLEKFLGKYSLEDSKIISKMDMEKFLKFICDILVEEGAPFDCLLLVTVKGLKDDWHKWFEITNLKIHRKVLVEDGSVEKVYLCTMDSLKSVEKALQSSCPNYIKLKQPELHRVVITNAQVLDEDELDCIKTISKGYTSGEPLVHGDLRLLTFSTPTPKLNLLEQKEITLKHGNSLFLDTIIIKNISDLYFKQLNPYLIHMVKNGTNVDAEFWPVEEVKNIQEKISGSPVMRNTYKEDQTKRRSITETNQTSLSFIPHSLFEQKYATLSDLNEVNILSFSIWNPILCRDLIIEGKKNTKRTEEWRDPSLCSIRVLVGSTTKVAIKSCFYYYVPTKQLEYIFQINPDAESISQNLLLVREIEASCITTKVILKPLPSSPPYKTSKVLFYSQDTLHCAENFSRETKQQVLILNMANENHPGGGWKSGKIAQEEELFRRTDISKALIESEFYPIPEFGALHTKNVTTFRGSEDNGYDFLENPFMVDVISLAAYNGNHYLEKGLPSSITTNGPGGKPQLRKKLIAKTYRKLVTILHFAAQQKYHTVILGALGCGAFKNPPEDISNIFREVISQYAGWIPQIVFAILGNQNFDVFQKNISEEYPATSVVMQPEQFNYTCEYSGKCWLDKEDHLKTFYHPPRCPKSSCDHSEERIHGICYTHFTNCPDGANCQNYWDVTHQTRLRHPSRCPKGAKCDEQDSEHLINVWHPPYCEQGNDCQRSKCQYRHKGKIQCPLGIKCREFDTRHHIAYQHPFLPPCKELLTCKNSKNLEHCKSISHLCPWGGACKKLGKPKHVKKYYHFVNHPCPENEKCRNLEDEIHLATYTHVGIPDIRDRCHKGTRCPERNLVDHVKTYSHPYHQSLGLASNTVYIVDLYNPDNLRSDSYEDLEISRRITFWDNIRKQKKYITEFQSHKNRNDLDINGKSFSEISKWFASLRPVHRLSKDTFLSVLQTGALLSLHLLNTLSNRENTLVSLTISHPRLQSINRLDEVINYARQVIRQTLITEQAAREIRDPSVSYGKSSFQEKELIYRSYETAKKELEVKKIDKKDMEIVESVARDVVIAAVNIKVGGIGHPTDAKVGTDKTVFTVMGPNTGYYGNIHIVLSGLLKWHPDFYITPCAATLFATEGYGKDRPWISPKNWENGGQEDFKTSKMHPICPDTSTWMAADFIGRVAESLKMPWNDVRLPDITQYYTKNDSHICLEGHLPSQVPLSYVDHVVMSMDIWNSLSKEEQKLAESIFPTIIKKTSGNDESFRQTMELATRPDPDRYRGLCFVLAPAPPREEEEEFFVPLKLFGKCCAIYFEVLGENFVICLCNHEQQNSSRHNISVYISRKLCAIAPVPPREVLKNNPKTALRFDHGLDHSQPIFYVLISNMEANTISLGHWGPSEIYGTSQPLIYESQNRLPDLRYMSILVTGPNRVRIHNLHTTMEPHPPALNLSLNPKPQTHKQQQKKNPFSKKRCPNDRNCILCYQKSEQDPERKKHINQYTHLCIHGYNCNRMKDPEHASQFEHEKKKKCPNLPHCRKTTNPNHRQDYFHPGLWDWMLPCRNGSSCDKERCNSEKYYHPPK